MIDFNRNIEQLDNVNDNDPNAANSPRGRNRLAKVLIGAAVILASVVVSTNLINSHYDGGHLNAKTTAVGEVAANGDHPTIVTADLVETRLNPRVLVPSIDQQAGEVVDDAAWRVQVFALRDQSNTAPSWSSLQQTNQDLLDGLEMHVQLAELTSGTFYRVQAGPLADRESAASLCESLKTRRQDCLIVAP